MLIYHLDAKITENRQSNMLKLCAKVSRGYARFHDSESRLSSARAVEEGGARCSTRSGARRSKNLTPTIQFHASSPLTFVTKTCLISLERISNLKSNGAGLLAGEFEPETFEL